MHVRDTFARAAAALAAAALAACAHSPDHRARSPETVVRDGYGGWIVVHTAGGAVLEGELIAIDTATVMVLGAPPRYELVAVPRSTIESAELWRWNPSIGGLVLWGAVGSASTLSHGGYLLVSLPVWLLVSSIASAYESQAPSLSYPRTSWSEIAIWARFPQGLPPGFRSSDLLHQDRTMRPDAAPGASPGEPMPPQQPQQPMPPPQQPMQPQPRGGASS